MGQSATSACCHTESLEYAEGYWSDAPPDATVLGDWSKVTDLRDPQTQFRPAKETLKVLRNKEDRRGGVDRWNEVKAEWEKQVQAELESRMRQGDNCDDYEEVDASGHQVAQWSTDERQQALMAIKLEQENQPPLEQQDVSKCNGFDGFLFFEPVRFDPVVEGPAEDEREVEIALEKEQTRLASEKEAERAALAARLKEFLAANGFAGPCAKRRRMMGIRTTFPLHLAAERGDVQLVKLLLQAGADKDQRDSSGRTPAQVVRKKCAKQAFRDSVLEALGEPV